jgi:hypothetical protein
LVLFTYSRFLSPLYSSRPCSTDHMCVAVTGQWGIAAEAPTDPLAVLIHRPSHKAACSSGQIEIWNRRIGLRYFECGEFKVSR